MKVLKGQINTKKYLGVLYECLWPTVQRYFAGGGYIFQEDNAPTHKGNLVKRYFQEKNTVAILWPMYSPDLSPIDNCWSFVKMRLQKEINEVKSNADLAQCETTIWTSILKPYMKAYLKNLGQCRLQKEN